MEDLKNKKLYKRPFLFSILIILIYNSFTTVFDTITGFLTILINFFNNKNHEKDLTSIFEITSPLSIIISTISILLLNLIFKNLKIYKIKNFFKTLKISSFYLIFTIFSLMCAIYENVNHQFKPFNEIILGVLSLVFEIGFVEESLFRGLILNIFAKKYLDEYRGILKILIFPAIIFGLIHLLNVFAGVNLEKAILQAFLAFFIGILLNAIYMRGGNIFVLILIHAIIDASGLFKTFFIKEIHLTNIDAINQTSYTELFYIPLYLLLAIFLLRKSKLEEVKENLKTINKI